MSLLEQAIAAHGGRDRWQQLQTIEVKFRCGGLAMRLKSQPDALSVVDAIVDTRRPHVELKGLGVFDGDDVRPAHMARRFRWQTPDVVHFAGYALWGYMTAPFLFIQDGFRVEERRGRRLSVQFPAHIPTHSRHQTFYFDGDARLRRLDYTAEVMAGPFARARHDCWQHTWFDGLLVPIRRRVTPRGPRAPTLISIDVDEFHAH